MITVDFDLEEVRFDTYDKPRKRTDFETTFFLLRWNYVCKKANCRVCLSRKGLHLYIDDDRRNDFGLRAYLGDDPIRLDIDLKRRLKGLEMFADTLFNEKAEGSKSYKEMCLDFESFFKEYLKTL